MIQTQKHSLSEPEKDTLHDWLNSPGADLFLKCIRAETADLQAETGMYYASRLRGDVTTHVNEHKAQLMGSRADELQFMIDKIEKMRDEKYPFYTVTLTP